MVMYTLTKFGANWLIFVDASVNKKIEDGWTDTDGGWVIIIANWALRAQVS